MVIRAQISSGQFLDGLHPTTIQRGNGSGSSRTHPEQVGQTETGYAALRQICRRAAVPACTELDTQSDP